MPNIQVYVPDTTYDWLREQEDGFSKAVQEALLLLMEKRNAK